MSCGCGTLYRQQGLQRLRRARVDLVASARIYIFLFLRLLTRIGAWPFFISQTNAFDLYTTKLPCDSPLSSRCDSV